ncbi:MAG: CpaF family protein [Nanoarchaeota archaeon]|nr:CpaF family protein [Nanoarchaeota archaeon]
MQKEIEEYKIKSEQIEVTVKIFSGKKAMLSYELTIPQLEPATKALLDEIRSVLVTEVQISTAEILDPKSVSKLKEKFSSKALTLIKKKLPKLAPDVRTYLVGILLQEMLGLGPIEFLLNDPGLEEIVVTSAKEPIRIYHKRHGWLETNITIPSEDQIQNYSSIIARRVGRQVTTLNPLLDAHLVTGDRANAVLYPICTKGNTITIRKFARDPWTVTDFITNKTCPAEIFALIWQSIQYEMNILVSGGTASGKTSFLNTILPFIPPNQRIISIEDTRELQLSEHLYWCPLVTRQSNPEGKGEVSMLDLLINSLRMRPDRIILGEMRRKDQAQVLFEAMHTGHSVYATVHADTIGETIKRLTHPPIEVPTNLLSAVNLNVVMFRDRRKGMRRVMQVGEYIATEEGGESTIKPNILYRWKPDKDVIVQHSDSLRLREELSRFTGMTQKEVNIDLKAKERILNWMVKQKLRGIDVVGKIMNSYYTDPKVILDLAEKNKSFELVK